MRQVLPHFKRTGNQVCRPILTLVPQSRLAQEKELLARERLMTLRCQVGQN